MAGDHPLARAQQDWKLERRVVAALTERNMPSLKQLQVSATDGTVILRGKVRSFYEKQLSNHCARLVKGITRLVDEIEVVEAVTFKDPQLLYRASIGGISLVLVLAIVVFASRSGGQDPRLPVFPVQGKIAYEDQATPGAQIVFYPQAAEPDAPRPRGVVDRQGNFTLSTYEQGDGAPPGDYLVTVEWPQCIGKGEDTRFVNRLPPVYRSPKTTDLRASVRDVPDNLVRLTLGGSVDPNVQR